MQEEYQRLKQDSFPPSEPSPLVTNRRPFKGIFLTYFLLFAGLIFFLHGFHRFEEYSAWDLIAVWLLSFLLIIPGSYFGIYILAIECKIKGFKYNDIKDLYG